MTQKDASTFPLPDRNKMVEHLRNRIELMPVISESPKPPPKRQKQQPQIKARHRMF